MKKLLEKLINEAIMEALSKFNFNELRTKTNYNDIVLYARSKQFDSIGEGSSRLVFYVGKNRVVKIAMNPKGFAQNVTEKTISLDPETENAVTKYDTSLEGNIDGQLCWIVTEVARPLTSTDEFTKLTGFDWNFFIRTIKDFSKTGGSVETIINILLNAVSSDYKQAELKGDKADMTTNKALLDSLQKMPQSPLFSGIIKAIQKYKLLPGDLGEVDHYGITPASKVVLLDSGYTESVHIQFYGGKEKKTSSQKPRSPAKRQQQSRSITEPTQTSTDNKTRIVGRRKPAIINI